MTPYLNADTEPHIVSMKKHHPGRDGRRCRDSIFGGTTRAPGAPDANFVEVSESFL